MKKGLLVTTGLACLGLLTACSAQDNMAKKEMTQDTLRRVFYCPTKVQTILSV